MRHHLFAILGLGLALAGTPAHAEPVVLQPGSPWNIDFGEKSCRLTRFFGASDKPHVLIIDQYWPDRHFGLALAGPLVNHIDGDGKFALRFFEGQEPILRVPFKGSIEGFGAAYFYTRIGIATEDQPATGPQPIGTRFPAVDTSTAKDAAFVSLSAGGNEIRLATGPLDDAFQILNQCAQDFVGFWGLDQEKHRTATRMPYWTNETAMAPKFIDIIPFERIKPGERGIVRLRMIIDEAGKLVDCTVIEAPDVELVERPVCKAMKQARFEPGLDADGKPMRSFYATTIIYAAD
jgi:TonB family protein